MKKLFPILFILVFVAFACNEDEFLTPDTADFQLEERTSYPDIIDLPDGFQPEGIVVGNGHDAYVGSLFSGQILKIDLSTGTGTLLVETSFVPCVGLAYDHRTDYLFVARGYAGLVSVYHSVTGVKVTDFVMTSPGPIPTTWVNDLIVTKKAVYVTDSFRPVMYKIPLGPGGQLPDQSEVVEIPLTGDFSFSDGPGPFGLFFNSNGIDATPNGKHLIMANSDFGEIYHVDPMTGVATTIDFGGIPLPGADGILLEPLEEGYHLYVVQNVFNSVAKIYLNPDLISGNLIQVITNPEFKIPTTLDEFGGHLYVVNARFDVASPFEPAPGIAFDVVKIDK